MTSKNKSILQLDAREVEKFLLQQESYCNFSLPSYFNFKNMLIEVDEFLKAEKFCNVKKREPREFTKVNYQILNNKDGRYAWIPFQLIHPVLYVRLVHLMTQKDNWERISKKFSEYYKDEKIQCLSIPNIRDSEDGNGELEIVHRWKEYQQKSIEYALEYQYILKSSITEWHDSLYTHSIPWALHGKETAKKIRGPSLLGNRIDKLLQAMSNGQTNGIPRGSVVTDFIAEMVLGSADLELKTVLEDEKIEDYKILRYRKGYRIFVNNPADGERILKAITERMIELGMQLNPSKTKVNNRIIIESTKEAQISWITKMQSHDDIQKHLLIIHSHATSFPNSGSLARALISFGKKIEEKELDPKGILPSISIAVDIAYHNPRVYPQATAVLNKLIISLKSKEEKRSVVQKIFSRFSNLPNINHMEIWLQRISFGFYKDWDYKEPLCKFVAGEAIDIWNNEWISSDKLKKIIEPEKIIDRDNLKELSPHIFRAEMNSLRSPD